MSKLANVFASLREAKQNAAFVRDKHGLSMAAQALDLFRLRSQGIGPSDYYKYSLFDRNVFPDQASRKTYRGWRLQRELRRYVDPRLRSITYEKHLLYRLLPGFGLPCPEIHAVYAPANDSFERHRALKTRAELAAFMRETEHIPLFGKPSSSSHGYGARGVLARVGADRLLLADHSEVSIDDFVADVDHITSHQGTYLLVEMLEPRDDIRKLCGDTLSSIRMVILMRNGEPEIYHCGSLLPPAKAHVSNARGLTTGTLSSRIDPVKGCFQDVICSAGPDRRSQPVHPDTGERIEGFPIKDWPQLLELVFTAARAFSPFRMQHWDLSLTTRGPVLLEMNYVGDIEPLQMHGPPGACTEQYLSFAATHQIDIENLL